MNKNRSKANKITLKEERGSMTVMENCQACVKTAVCRTPRGRRDSLLTLLIYGFGESGGLKRKLVCILALHICKESEVLKHASAKLLLYQSEEGG